MKMYWIGRVLVVLLLAPAMLNGQVVYKERTFDKHNGEVSLSVSYPEIQNTQPPSLKAKLSEIIMNLVLAPGPVGNDDSAARSVDDMYAKFIAERKAFDKENGESVPWEFDRAVKIVYQSRRVLCLELHEDGFTGGAHPFGETRYLSLRPDTGEKITLNDLIREGQRANLTSIAEKNLRATYSIPADKSLEDVSFLVERLELTENFAITKSGITFFYNEEISSHAMGPVFIELPYPVIHDVLKPDLELPSR
jgi:hypothetical protein